MFDYELTRCNKRKSIALQVVDGKVLVKAPSQVSISYINKLLLAKESWIEQKIEQQLVVARYANRICNDGVVWLNGVAHQITVLKGTSPNVVVKNGVVYCTLKTAEHLQESVLLKKQLELWFKQQALTTLSVRAKQLSLATGLIPSEIIIKKYRARWGSCDNHDRVSLNYFLLMLPSWVVDYVIIHELCHLKYLNHSAQFWSLVEHHDPDYKKAKRWLNQHQGYLVWPKI